jgi:hypothetical protein
VSLCSATALSVLTDKAFGLVSGVALRESIAWHSHTQAHRTLP